MPRFTSAAIEKSYNWRQPMRRQEASTSANQGSRHTSTPFPPPPLFLTAQNCPKVAPYFVARKISTVTLAPSSSQTTQNSSGTANKRNQ